MEGIVYFRGRNDNFGVVLLVRAGGEQFVFVFQQKLDLGDEGRAKKLEQLRVGLVRK